MPIRKNLNGKDVKYLPYKSCIPFNLKIRFFTLDGRPKKGPRSCSADMDSMACMAKLISSVITASFCCTILETVLDVAALSISTFLRWSFMLLLAFGGGLLTARSAWLTAGLGFIKSGVEVLFAPLEVFLCGVVTAFWNSTWELGKALGGESLKSSAKTESESSSSQTFGVCWSWHCLIWSSTPSSLARKELSPTMLS